MTVANTYLSFQGVGFSTGYRRSFDVMVGDNPPTITGGYAKWTPLARPLQRSLTVFAGYDPVQMNVDVRFGRWTNAGGWQTDDTAGVQVEEDIGRLEWMAGSNFQQGPSPVVYVYSHGIQGTDTNMVPPQYANVPWIITGVQWGRATRNPSGYRIWQDASLTLQHYLNLSVPPAADTSVRGGYFVTAPGRDTPLLIAGAPTVRSPLVDHRILAGRICDDPANNPCRGTSIRLRGKSLSFHIRQGVQVFIAGHQSL